MLTSLTGVITHNVCVCQSTMIYTLNKYNFYFKKESKFGWRANKSGCGGIASTHRSVPRWLEATGPLGSGFHGQQSEGVQFGVGQGRIQAGRTLATVWMLAVAMWWWLHRYLCTNLAAVHLNEAVNTTQSGADWVIFRNSQPCACRHRADVYRKALDG